MTRISGYREQLIRELCELRDCRDYYNTCLDGLIPELATEGAAAALRAERRHNEHSISILNQCLPSCPSEECVPLSSRMAILRSHFEIPGLANLKGSARDARLLLGALNVADSLFNPLRLAWTLARILETPAIAVHLEGLVADDVLARLHLKDGWAKTEALSDRRVNGWEREGVGMCESVKV